MNTVLGFRQEPTELLIGFEYCNIFVHLLCAALEPAEHAIINQSKQRKKIQQPICKLRLCECPLVLNI